MSDPLRDSPDLQTPEGVDDLYCTMIAPLLGDQVFSRGFAPHKVLYRGPDISTLIKYFNQELHHPQQPYNLALLSGPVGTGKHLVAHTAIQSLRLLLEAIYQVVEIDILCDAIPLEILIQIFHQIAKTSFPLAGNMSIEGMVQLIGHEIRRHPTRVYFILLQEVERLSALDRKELLKALTRIGEIDAHRPPQTVRQVNLVVLTNEKLTRNYLASRREIILGYHKKFLPYSEDQLYSIVESRAKYLTHTTYQPPEFTNAIMELVTKMTIRTHPNAHLAVHLLQHVMGGNGVTARLTPENLEQGLQAEMERIDLTLLDSLPKPQRLLVCTLAQILDTHGVTEVTTPELKTPYRINCAELEIKEPSDSRIAEFLKSLQERGIISQRGKIGRPSHIRLLPPITYVLRLCGTYKLEKG